MKRLQTLLTVLFLGTVGVVLCVPGVVLALNEDPVGIVPVASYGDEELYGEGDSEQQGAEDPDTYVEEDFQWEDLEEAPAEEPDTWYEEVPPDEAPPDA